ncbi:hypothetical protein DPMN_139973 [Dreissena polymorpha]|uniref:Uncharacterized protein n=1 Tax=Dreissena polymorpha TaxID=45954 RepID=A0A9D4JJY1_DREPO|nr:hypothetical protein DPMN_139973 [Dreissena polymorpha]
MSSARDIKRGCSVSVLYTWYLKEPVTFPVSRSIPHSLGGEHSKNTHTLIKKLYTIIYKHDNGGNKKNTNNGGSTDNNDTNNYNNDDDDDDDHTYSNDSDDDFQITVVVKTQQ